MTVQNFIKKFTDKKLKNVIEIRKNFFEASDELLDIKKKVPKEPYSIGKFLGYGKPFHPSIALLDWLNDRTDRYVMLNKKASWLFLCGRDGFSGSIVDKSVDSGEVIVKNQFDEVLGYGDFASRKIREKRLAIRNILDRGDFLRREKR